LKEAPLEGTWSSGSALTRRLTGTTTDGFDAPGAEISISPVQVPAGRFVTFAWTLIVLGVAPEAWESTIQLLPHVIVRAVAVKLTFEPVLLVIDSVWAAGVEVPI
jgi:hypothetical protein